MYIYIYIYVSDYLSNDLNLDKNWNLLTWNYMLSIPYVMYFLWSRSLKL